MLVLGAAACASASGSVVTLSSYAAGKWACTMKATGGGHTFTLKPKAVVTATSTTTGAVTITIPSSPPFPAEKVSGQWKLGGSELTVTWSDPDQGTTQAKPISLGAKQFKIRSAPPRGRAWSKVTVDRKSRSVTFGFPTVPGGPSDGTMTCTKA